MDTEGQSNSSNTDWNATGISTTTTGLFASTDSSDDGTLGDNSSLSDPAGGCLQLDYIPYSNPGNEMSIQSMLLVFKVLGGGLVPLICFLGVPVNVLNCVVFFKQGLRERINMLLFCLAIVDCIVDVFLFVSTIEYFYTQVQGNFQINGPLVTFITNYGSIVYGAVYVSGFITTLISFERCICITHPLVAKHALKTRTMGIVVGVVSVALTAFIYLVSAEKYRIRCGYYARLNVKLYVHYPSDFYIQNKPLMDILNGIVYGVLLPSFFVLSTTITTAITAVKLRGVANWRQNQSSAPVTMESKEVALTKMLIAVSILFIVCTLPNVILRIAPLFVDEFRLGGRKQNLLLSGICVIYLANAINSALNFVFYYKMGSRFRMCVKSLFVKQKKPSAAKGSTMTATSEISTGQL
ncbi:probable G-protein coupled receptor 139 [Littorina saxatilis]|uniref:G-protein coupled receptors family 1 profile domain-containing protein n=1 Tax=Littorina saxatilis TaxID=31220 RepID=A0AAN9BX14_9CAEN